MILNIPTGPAVPTFTDFNGNDKRPEGTIMASWKMTHRNPHLMYDSTFYINDSPNAPFDVLLGSRTLFNKGIYTLSRAVQGSLPLIHKPTSLRKSFATYPILSLPSSSLFIVLLEIPHDIGVQRFAYCPNSQQSNPTTLPKVKRAPEPRSTAKTPGAGNKKRKRRRSDGERGRGT
jgi:hypothetical protein